MIKPITWAMIQKENKRKERKEKIKKVLEWVGLVLVALVITPFLWLVAVIFFSL